MSIDDTKLLPGQKLIYISFNDISIKIKIISTRMLCSKMYKALALDVTMMVSSYFKPQAKYDISWVEIYNISSNNFYSE